VPKLGTRSLSLLFIFIFPVLDEDITQDGPIEADKILDQIRSEGYALPASFEWCDVDMTNEQGASLCFHISLFVTICYIYNIIIKLYNIYYIDYLPFATA
jgi:hypothetical protein